MSTPPPDPAELLGRLRATLADVEARTAEYRDELAAHRARATAEDEQRAAAARRGELGLEWQRVQQRIDLGTTSLTDVFSGADDSPEAATLRRRAADNAAVVREQMERYVEATTDPDAVFLENREMRNRLQERLRRLSAMNADLLRPDGG